MGEWLWWGANFKHSDPWIDLAFSCETQHLSQNSHLIIILVLVSASRMRFLTSSEAFDREALSRCTSAWLCSLAGHEPSCCHASLRWNPSLRPQLSYKSLRSCGHTGKVLELWLDLPSWSRSGTTRRSASATQSSSVKTRSLAQRSELVEHSPGWLLMASRRSQRHRLPPNAPLGPCQRCNPKVDSWARLAHSWQRSAAWYAYWRRWGWPWAARQLCCTPRRMPRGTAGSPFGSLAGAGHRPLHHGR